MSDKRLYGSTAVVTGAARGIGLAIATHLARAGAAVALVDRNDERVEVEAEVIRQAGGEAIGIAADVTSAADMAGVLAQCSAWKSVVDIVCPNAAVFDPSPIVDMSEDLWDKLLSVNLKGVFLTVRAFAPAMLASRRGRFVVTSSITGSRTAIAGMSHYAASKAGINGFIRGAALEFAPHQVTINAIEPGHVMTEGAAPGYDEGFLRAVEAFIPLGRIADPDDIAKVAVFLASDDSAYITGQTIVVDGGVTLPEYPPYSRG